MKRAMLMMVALVLVMGCGEVAKQEEVKPPKEEVKAAKEQLKQAEEPRNKDKKKAKEEQENGGKAAQKVDVKDEEKPKKEEKEEPKAKVARKDRANNISPNSKQLDANFLKLGQRGRADYVTVKVRQVLDEGRVLLALDDSRTLAGNWGVTVLVKCDTKGLVDGAFLDNGAIKDLLDSDWVEVTGTYRYKTKSGTRTVFVISATEK